MAKQANHFIEEAKQDDSVSALYFHSANRYAFGAALRNNVPYTSHVSECTLGAVNALDFHSNLYLFNPPVYRLPQRPSPLQAKYGPFSNTDCPH